MRKHFNKLKAQLENERSSFKAHWHDVADYLLPRRPRFFITDVNKGDRRSQKIVDSTGTLALKALSAGMMSGITSPSRPWFKLSVHDPDLSEFGRVKEWLEIVTKRMQTVFLKSNLYNRLPTTYGELGGFGTSAMSIEPDTEDVVRFYQFPIGSYCLATDDRQKVAVCIREYQMTIRQMIQKFGIIPGTNEINWELFSPHIKNSYDDGMEDSWVAITHVIQPNKDYDPNNPLSKYKRFKSCYYETGAMGSNTYLYEDYDRLLSESGFDFFPILAPRWEVTGEDVYGTNCPGFEALPDIKQLQVQERRCAQAIEKMVNPPMNASLELKNSATTILPGKITWMRDPAQGFRPSHEVNLRIDALEQKSQQIRYRIDEAFFKNLFLMISQSDRRDITAREIEERHEEKLLALGPVLEQVNQDLLDPLIDNTFAIMNDKGLLPEAPEELHGMPLKVEYVSIMAQAQKLIGLGALERFSAYVGSLAPLNPSVLDKWDMEQAIDEYGEITGISARVIRTDDDVNNMRAQRAQMQQAQMQAQMIQQSAQTAKILSETDTQKESALKELANQVRGI